MSLAKRFHSNSLDPNSLAKQALSLNEEERKKFLSTLAKQDKELCQRVEHLILEIERHQTITGSNRSFGDRNSVSLSVVKSKFKLPVFYEANEEVDSFLIKKVAGHGAFAVVYLAWDKSLSREVALKVSENTGNEARTMARLEHENIVTVYSETIDAENNVRKIAMSYVAGTTLEKLLKGISYEGEKHIDGAKVIRIIDKLSMDQSPLFNPSELKYRKSLEEGDYQEAILSIGIQLAHALDYAHNSQILHLDIKPSNILISPYGRPMLTDFNVSIHRSYHDPNDPIGGTQAYMSPEQKASFDRKENFLSSKVDNRADIYSLGVVFREMLDKATDAKFQPLVRIINRCTSENPNDRYETAEQLANDLGNALELRRALKFFSPPGKFLKLIIKYPFAALTACLVFPQLISGYISRQYYELRIDSLLTIPQQDLFDTLLYFYYPSIYLIGTIVWFTLLSSLIKFQKQGSLSNQNEALSELRRKALALPVWMIGISLAGWVPGSLFFPLMIHFMEGPIPSSVFAHFTFSFAICSLIALSYSYLGSLYLVLRIFYPYMLIGCSKIQTLSNSELKPVEKRTREFHRIPSLAPLIGAAAILLQEPLVQRLSDSSLPNLILFMIFIGILGVVAGTQINFLLSEVFKIFIGRSPAPETYKKPE